jgi:hypothetical protein
VYMWVWVYFPTNKTLSPSNKFEETVLVTDFFLLCVIKKIE